MQKIAKWIHLSKRKGENRNTLLVNPINFSYSKGSTDEEMGLYLINAVCEVEITSKGIIHRALATKDCKL